MSERTRRKSGQKIIADVLPDLKRKRESQNELIAALEHAVTILGEEPQPRPACRILVELVPISSFQTFRAHCDCCDSVLDGFNDNFRFCPMCGSRITDIRHEETAEEASNRLTEAAIKEHFANVGRSS